MDWSMILLLCMAAALVWAFYKIYRLKKEVYHFANQVEMALDRIMNGDALEDAEETEDSLWGKISERLKRIQNIWKNKESEGIREKKQMKEFISDISHQTKTPISNIKIYLEFLQEEKTKLAEPNS